MVGEEALLPYHRPPLSKTYLKGEKRSHQLLIKPRTTYEKAEIELLLGTRAESIDRESRTVQLDNGDNLLYEKLALVTGARPRKISLPGCDKAGVIYLRNIADARCIRHQVASGKDAVIIGGGYVGLEAAAALCEAGMAVTVLEANPRVLQCVTTEAVSNFYERVHAEEGVNIVVKAEVERIDGHGAVDSVACANGQSFPADVVIIGVGVQPNVELAETAGLECENGIVVDEFARTSDPDIVAAGDCSWHYNPIYDRHIRLESVQHAIEQANVAAASICGKLSPYDALPWFWSDQYDVRLQIAGLSQGYDEVIVRGATKSGRGFAAFYLRQGRLLAVDAVNKPREFLHSKHIIRHRKQIDVGGLVDENILLNDLVIN